MTICEEWKTVQVSATDIDDSYDDDNDNDDDDNDSYDDDNDDDKWFVQGIVTQSVNPLLVHAKAAGVSRIIPGGGGGGGE